MRTPSKRPPISATQIRVLESAQKKTKSAVREAALNKKIKSLKKPTNVNILAKQLGFMSIPKELKTKSTIMKIVDQNAIVKLNSEIMKTLKDIYKMSEKEQREYAGLIDFTIEENYAFMTSHTTSTSCSRSKVTPPLRMKTTKIMYHSHPAPKGRGTSLVSIPSEMDFTAYLEAQKKGVVEGNLILDQNGVYVIDVVDFNKKGDVFKSFMFKINKKQANRFKINNDLFFMNLNIEKWQEFINNDVDVYMMENHSVSVKYYKWTELPLTRISL